MNSGLSHSQSVPRLVPTALRERVMTDLDSRYIVTHVVGTGAFGVVARVFDCVSGGCAALKCFHQPGSEARSGTPHDSNFYRELRALFRLQHPHIVEIRNLFELPCGRRYLLLEYCSGGNLRRWFERWRRAGEPMPVGAVRRLALQMLAAIGKAHELGLVHLDLKPENVLFVEEPWSGPAFHAKVADFGLARAARRLKGDGRLYTVSGSPAYMAPEQFSGEYGPGSDYYALGVMLYEALAGERPFEGAVNELAQQHCHKAPRIGAWPAPWPELVGALLAKDPGERLTEPVELITAVRTAPR